MSHSGGKIYKDSPYGISIKDIKDVLGSSRSDIGGLIEYGNINKWAVQKPVRSDLVSGTESEIKVPAKYGWNITTKSAGSNTVQFINSLRTTGDSSDHWEYLKPRGGSQSPKEWYRILDFDRYNHAQLPYRTPAFMTRLASSQISINGGQPLTVEIARNGTATQTLTSTAFSLNDAYDVTVLVTIQDPNPESAASYIHWDVDGDFQIELIDSNNRVVDSDYQTGFGIKTGNLPQTISLHFDGFHSMDGYTGPFRIQYRVHMENHTYYMDGSNTVYVPVTIQIDTPYAATLTMSKTGQDGVVVRPAGVESEWRDNAFLARETIFGASGSWPIVVVEVSNGSSTQRKICLVPNSGFIPFRRIGITISPRAATDSKDVIVYLLYGNYHQIFPDMENQVDYGDLSLADQYKLTCAPNCYNELGIIPVDPTPIVVYQDDCQGADFYYTNSTSQIGLTPTANGFTGQTYGVTRFKLRWGIGIDNLVTDLQVTMVLTLYDSDYDFVASQERVLTTSGTFWNDVVEFDFNPLYGSYNPFELYAKLSVEVNGELYYIRFYPQSITTTDPEFYPLGWD